MWTCPRHTKRNENKYFKIFLATPGTLTHWAADKTFFTKPFSRIKKKIGDKKELWNFSFFLHHILFFTTTLLNKIFPLHLFLFPQIISSILFTSQFTSPFWTETMCLDGMKLDFFTFLIHCLQKQFSFEWFFRTQEGDEKARQAGKKISTICEKEKRKSNLKSMQISCLDLI